MEETGGCKSVDISPPCLRQQKDPRGCVFAVVFPSPRPGALLARCPTAKDCPWVRARFIFTAAPRWLAHALGLQSPTPARRLATGKGQPEAPRRQPGAHAAVAQGTGRGRGRAGYRWQLAPGSVRGEGDGVGACRLRPVGDFLGTGPPGASAPRALGGSTLINPHQRLRTQQGQINVRRVVCVLRGNRSAPCFQNKGSARFAYIFWRRLLRARMAVCAQLHRGQKEAWFSAAFL